MGIDAAYTSKYLQMALLLLHAAEGNPADIPDHYANHLSHRYNDGDVSLAPLLNRFEFSEEIEDYEFEEALELLGKVRMEDWPFSEDVESVDVLGLLKVYDRPPFSDIEDFSEKTREERVEEVLTHSIESVFGAKVEKVRAQGGKFFSKDNEYGRGEEGSFKGQFEFDGKIFDFEIAPDELGWAVQYRMQAQSYDSLPPIPGEEADKHESERRIRNKGWN